MGGKTPSQENSHHSDVILIFPAAETKVQRGSVPCGGGDLNWGTHAKSCSSEDTGIECPVHVFQRLGGKARKRGQQWQVGGLLARGRQKGEASQGRPQTHADSRQEVTVRDHSYLGQMIATPSLRTAHYIGSYPRVGRS